MTDDDFGHFFGRASNICIDSWGAGPFVIRTSGKEFRFEDSDRFGPSRVNKNGEIAANPFFGEHSPFYVAHRCWVRQGRRLEADGVTCIWDQPKPTKLRRLNRRNALIVERGEEDGGYMFVEDTAALVREG